MDVDDDKKLLWVWDAEEIVGEEELGKKKESKLMCGGGNVCDVLDIRWKGKYCLWNWIFLL